MMTELANYLQLCFTGANLPATVVLIVVMIYWSMAIVSGLDFDLFDINLDIDADGALDSVTGFGFLVLRFLNIGRVPLMIWVSVFGLVFWLVSMLFSSLMDNPELRDQWFYASQYALRNLAIGVMFTKILTQPLRGKFDVVEPNRAEEMLGRECTVTSSSVDEAFGQAQYKTEGAPLNLHVRTRGESLAKGDRAVIVEYDRSQNIYYVARPKDED